MSNSIDYDTWVETYKPIENTITPNGSHDNFMFETFGADVEFLKSLKKPNIFYWTLIAEGDESSIINGISWINRIGYFVTKNPAKDGVYVTL